MEASSLLTGASSSHSSASLQPFKSVSPSCSLAPVEAEVSLALHLALALNAKADNYALPHVHELQTIANWLIARHSLRKETCFDHLRDLLIPWQLVNPLQCYLARLAHP